MNTVSMIVLPDGCAYGMPVKLVTESLVFPMTVALSSLTVGGGEAEVTVAPRRNAS